MISKKWVKAGNNNKNRFWKIVYPLFWTFKPKITSSRKVAVRDLAVAKQQIPERCAPLPFGNDESKERPKETRRAEQTNIALLRLIFQI